MTIIKVTQEHINKGIRSNSCECPIALALRELGYRYVSVGPNTMVVDRTRYFTNDAIKIFTMDFDLQRGPVNPFEFDLDSLDVNAHIGQL